MVHHEIPKGVLESRYEEIRNTIIVYAGVLASERQGLSLILKKGLSTWIRIWSRVEVKPRLDVMTSTTVRPIENDHVTNQIVSILTTIALHNEREIYV